MNRDEWEERTFATTLREVQAVGRPYRFLEGRAVPYDTWADVGGWFLEQHAGGSFKRSTNGRSGTKLPLLLMHDRTDRLPIGHAERWTHDDGGLDGVWRLNDSADAQTAARMAEAGDLVGLSIGFLDVASPRWEWPSDFDPDLGPEHKARVTRQESRLVEVSMTPTPAFSDAGVTMVRTLARPPRTGDGRTAGSREKDRWREVVEGLKLR